MSDGTIVIYHAGCWDGFCAAWLLSKAYPDAVFHAAHYGTDPPIVTGKRVIIADFSYPRAVMRKILSSAHHVIVLDHHKTAEKELGGLVEEFRQRPDLIQSPIGSELPIVAFDMDKSGGRITWEYLYGNRLLLENWLSTSKSGYSLEFAPWLVDYTEDRDLWLWKLPHSREVNAYIRSFPLEFEQWDKFRAVKKHHALWEIFISQGAAILRSEAQIIDIHVKHAREIEMCGHKVLSVNATLLFSDIAGKLAEGRPFGAVYFDRGDGKRQWSLRSRDGGVDVSEVAKSHGGGGHYNAAGFEESL